MHPHRRQHQQPASHRTLAEPDARLVTDEIEKAISAREDEPEGRLQSRYRDSSADLDEDWGGVELAAAHGFDDEDWE